MTLDVPQQSFADTPISISARGARPRAPITFTLKTVDALGNTWSSTAICSADANGTIRINVCAPNMQLFWSMKPMSGSPKLYIVPKDAAATYELTAADGTNEVAHATFQRVYASAGVQRIDLTGDVVGTAFIPAGGGAHPAVLLIGGSGGGHPMDALAALLASRGYVTLSLAYFRGASLPNALVEIPVETAGRALAWLKARPEVDAKRIGVIGHSRGSELALLTGAYYPDVKAVVALAPSPFVWGAVDDSTHSGWTYQGKPLTFVPPPPPNDPNSFFAGFAQRVESTPDAWIPIEKINGPILFVVGENDAMWPSLAFSQAGLARLKEKHHAFNDVMLSYPNAGHWMFESYIPEFGRVTLNSPQTPFAFGGTPEGDAAAAAKSWPEIMQFLAKNLEQ